MADLVNTFSWSASRAKLFRTCPRAYYFNHYGMWGGWSADAPTRARLAYRLKNITGLVMWGGSIVHRTIEQLLVQQRDRRRQQADATVAPSLIELQQAARELMIRDWRQSRDGLWRQDPKRNCNLFELYYGFPREEVDRTAVRVRDRSYRCLEVFLRQGAWDRLQRLAATDWLGIEELAQFSLEGIPIWVQLDVMINETEGITLIDWKTGRPSEDDLGQVAVYALYAAQRWPEQIRTISTELHYLAHGQVIRHAPGASELEQARQAIMQSCQQMRALLRDPARNLAFEEDFPQVDREDTCRRCRFRELCGR